MNLEEARKLARETRRWAKVERGVACAEVVLELADEVERLRAIETAAKNLCESAGPLIEDPRREFVGSVEMDMLLSALYGPSEELMEE